MRSMCGFIILSIKYVYSWSVCELCYHVLTSYIIERNKTCAFLLRQELEMHIDSHLDTITHNTNRSSRNIKLYTYIFTRRFITNGSIKLKINK